MKRKRLKLRVPSHIGYMSETCCFTTSLVWSWVKLATEVYMDLDKGSGPGDVDNVARYMFPHADVTQKHGSDFN